MPAGKKTGKKAAKSAAAAAAKPKKTIAKQGAAAKQPTRAAPTRAGPATSERVHVPGVGDYDIDQTRATIGEGAFMVLAAKAVGNVMGGSDADRASASSAAAAPWIETVPLSETTGVYGTITRIYDTLAASGTAVDVERWIRCTSPASGDRVLIRDCGPDEPGESNMTTALEPCRMTLRGDLGLVEHGVFAMRDPARIGRVIVRMPPADKPKGCVTLDKHNPRWFADVYAACRAGFLATTPYGK